MEALTRYLTVRCSDPERFAVHISQNSPIALLQNAMSEKAEIRYSPILPAYLLPGQPPPEVPTQITSVAFFFSRAPHNALGTMKPELSGPELEQVYFTQGLASIVCVNCELSRARQLHKLMCAPVLEYWPIREGVLERFAVIIEGTDHPAVPSTEFVLETELGEDLAVYVEQILACLVTLRESYAIHNPGEFTTLDRIAGFTKGLIAQHDELSTGDLADTEEALHACIRRNSILSALGELGACLSYAVTQGTSGGPPILSNRSPFPQFSLLGIGGAVRAITSFTRYMEAAFAVRDVSDVIEKGYSCRQAALPAHIGVYKSGEEYKFEREDGAAKEEFDLGGDFPQAPDAPLIAYFSARHGFKESKFALTAASEALTCETSPQWTMMTLSHEIMHNRVREIFQTLFGSSWGQDRDSLLSEKNHMEFRDWIGDKDKLGPRNVDTAIRNAVLYFCCAMDRAMVVKSARREEDEKNITFHELCESYSRHKLRAMELFVHFHDYYFAYACQPKMYTMSLWASWIKVAAPYARPMDYVVRTLATIGCGTGLSSDAAVEQARDVLDDAFAELKRVGIHSPLFDKLSALAKDVQAYVLFKPSYYLIDQVRRFFASRQIAEKIDRIEVDPFAQGSTLAAEYSANPYVYGEDCAGNVISPIRYSLASFLRSLVGKSPITDPQWMTAWNTMVISSQEGRQW